MALKKLALAAALLAPQAYTGKPASPLLENQGFYTSRIVHQKKLEERVKEAVFKNDHTLLVTRSDGNDNLSVYSFATGVQTLLATNLEYVNKLHALETSVAYTVKETNELWVLGSWSPSRQWQIPRLKDASIIAIEGDTFVARVETENGNRLLLHYREQSILEQIEAISPSFFKSGKYDDSRLLNGVLQSGEILKYIAPSGAEVALYRAPLDARINDLQAARDNVSWIVKETVADGVQESYHLYHNGFEGTVSTVTNEFYTTFPTERGILFTRSDISTALLHTDLARGPTTWIFEGVVENAALEKNALYVLTSNPQELLKLSVEQRALQPPSLTAAHAQGLFGMSFQKETGYTYTLERSSDLVSWTPAASVIANTLPKEQVFVTPMSRSMRWFRLRVSETPPASDLLPPIP